MISHHNDPQERESLSYLLDYSAGTYIIILLPLLVSGFVSYIGPIYPLQPEVRNRLAHRLVKRSEESNQEVYVLCAIYKVQGSLSVQAACQVKTMGHCLVHIPPHVKDHSHAMSLACIVVVHSIQVSIFPVLFCI